MKRTTGWRTLAWVAPLTLVFVAAGCDTEEGYSVESVEAATDALAQDLDLDDEQMERLNAYGELACERHRGMAMEREGRHSELRDAMAEGTLDMEALHELIDANFDEMRENAHRETNEFMSFAESMDQGQRQEMAGRLQGFDEDVRASCSGERSTCGGSCSGGCEGRGGNRGHSGNRGSCSGDCGGH